MVYVQIYRAKRQCVVGGRNYACHNRALNTPSQCSKWTIESTGSEEVTLERTTSGCNSTTSSSGEAYKILHSEAMIGEIMGITGQDPSVCKSNRRLHVDILRFSFTKLGYSL